MGPQVEALAQEFKDLTAIKVDIKKWQSPVANQFKLRSIPAFAVYGKDGELKHEGKEAKLYVQRLSQKMAKRQQKK